MPLLSERIALIIVQIHIDIKKIITDKRVNITGFYYLDFSISSCRTYRVGRSIVDYFLRTRRRRCWGL